MPTRRDFGGQARLMWSSATAEVAAFHAVRAMPYALDGAHDADTLPTLGRGDCLAKSELLRDLLEECGREARMIRWPYRLPDVVAEVPQLPSRLDMHRAVQLRSGDGWVLLDATHHPGLIGTPLTVSTWDGATATESAYEPVGSILIGGVDEDRIDEILSEIGAWTDACPPELLENWRRAYIAWLRTHEAPT